MSALKLGQFAQRSRPGTKNNSLTRIGGPGCETVHVSDYLIILIIPGLIF